MCPIFVLSQTDRSLPNIPRCTERVNQHAKKQEYDAYSPLLKDNLFQQNTAIYIFDFHEYQKKHNGMLGL